MNTRNSSEKGGTLLKEPVQREWISYPEAERYSGLSHTTLWRYIGCGELKAARVGRSLRPALADFPTRLAEHLEADEWAVRACLEALLVEDEVLV
jgi:predicted DNA-binding transcriptional regulator AlpA